VLFDKAMNEKPLLKDRQIIIQGTTNDNDVFVSDMDSQHHFIMHEGRGKYYVLFDIISDVDDFYAVKTQEPKLEEGQTLIEGAVWVDKYTGEIKFDPKKNREDHRHHAIDALVIALTKESYFQELSKYNASVENKKRGNEYEKEQLKFVEPWNGFHTDARKVVNSILISFKQNRNILTEVRKKIVKNGKTYLSVGDSVRGQLHMENLYGKRTPPGGKEGYHRRESVESLISEKQLGKIVDLKIREIIIKARKAEVPLYNEIESLTKQLKSAKLRDFEEVVIKKNIVDLRLQIKRLYTLPNKNGESIPIKKVRVSQEIGNAQQLKPSIKQFVNPRNNHHIVIYKDANDILKDNITNFWNVVERVRQKDEIYKLPEIRNGETAPKELVLTFQENEMFLLGLSNDEFKDNVGNNSFLSNYLYRVQKISDGDYSFRHHLASTVTNKNEERRVASMKKYQEINPIKVKINLQGKLQIEEDIFNQIKIAEDQIKNGNFVEEKDFIFDVNTILANRK
jgi:CRISPR-associated endonuclease Csn1